MSGGRSVQPEASARIRLGITTIQCSGNYQSGHKYVDTGPVPDIGAACQWGASKVYRVQDLCMGDANRR